MTFPPPTPRQAQVIWFALTALAVALSLAILGAVVWGVGRVLLVLSPVLWPLAVAAIIAMILDPVVDWLVRRHVPRLRAIVLVFGVAAVLALGVVGSVLPRVVVEARDLAGRIPEYADKAKTKLQQWINEPPASLVPLIPKSILDRLPGRLRATETSHSGDGTNRTTLEVGVSTNRIGDAGGITGVPTGNRERLAGTNSTMQVVGRENGMGGSWWEKAMNPAALKTAGDWLATIIPEVGSWVVGQLGRVASWFGVLAGLALIPIYAFYFLLEKRGIETSWTHYLPVSDSRLKDEVVWLLENINDALIVFFRGQVLVAICDGVLYAIGFLVIGLPYALLLGMAAAVLTIVPFLGAIVTCAAALIIATIQFGDWQHPLRVLVVFAVVQGIEGWIIQPKIIGDRVGLHPLTIIIALLVGTTLMGGILGGLLAIPATAVIRALMFRYVWRARETR